MGVVTSKVTSREEEKTEIRVVSGKTYKDQRKTMIVVKTKYQQYTSLNEMLSKFSKVMMAHISFTAVINNGGIGKAIGGIRKGTKKNYIYVL